MRTVTYRAASTSLARLSLAWLGACLVAGLVACSAKEPPEPAPEREDLKRRPLQIPERIAIPPFSSLNGYRDVKTGKLAIPPRQVERLVARLQSSRPGPTLGAGVPFFFTANQGQADPKVSYVSLRPGYGVYLHKGGLTAALLPPEGNRKTGAQQPGPLQLLHMQLVGTDSWDAKAAVSVPAAVRYLRGSARTRAGEVVTQLALTTPYPGVDLTLFGEDHALHYAFSLDADAPVSRIRWQFRGASALRVDKEGNLRITLPGGGTLLQSAPLALEPADDDVYRTVAARYSIAEDDTVGLVLEGERTPGRALVIDPTLVFSTYFGGSGADGTLIDSGAVTYGRRGTSMTVGPNGRVYLAGSTTSSDLPITDATALTGLSDVFVAAIELEGLGATLAWATYLGGSEGETATAVSAGAQGSVYLVGRTQSSDFPIGSEGAFPARDDCGGFALKLDTEGALTAASHVGAHCAFHPNAAFWDSGAARLYVAGTARPPLEEPDAVPGSATSGVFQESLRGAYDAFAARFDADLGLDFLTYVGGTGNDVAMAVASHNGEAYLTGTTSSTDFPTACEGCTPLQSSLASPAVESCEPAVESFFVPWECHDAFVLRLNPDASALRYASYFGFAGEDFARGLAVDDLGHAHVAASVQGRNGGGSREAAVLKFAEDGSGLDYASYFAEGSLSFAEGVALDAQGRAHIVGTTNSDSLVPEPAGPATLQAERGGGTDMFYARLLASGEGDYFTYRGGAANEFGHAIATVSDSLPGTSGDDDAVCVFFSGTTGSDGLATAGALQETLASPPDLLLTVLCDAFVPPFPIKVFAPDSARPGEELFVLLTLNNPTNDAITDITISDEMPEELQILSVLPPLDCQVNGQTLFCPGNTVAPMSSLLITVTVRVRENTACAQSLLNEAVFSTPGFEFASEDSLEIPACPSPPAVCGDGVVTFPEVCDTALPLSDGECHECTEIHLCGDGDLDPGEECDTGGASDSCSADCRARVPPAEQCTVGGKPCADGLSCQADCTMYDDPCEGLLFFLCWLQAGSSGPSQFCGVPYCQ